MDIGTLTGQIQIEDQISGVLTHVTTGIQSLTGELVKMSGVSASTGAALSLVGGAFVGATAAVAGMTAAVIALGNRGSDVNDVAATFETFSGSVDVASESLKQMKAGTMGTVTDFDLMKSASKLLAAEVKLTSAEFGTMSKAAFVLQNQGLGSTKEMLDMVSQAMLTGRTRTLEMRIGKINLTDATKKLADSLNVEVQNLSEAGKTEARRMAIMEAMTRKVQEAGEQQRDFGEIMDSAVISIKNWGDELSSRVAESPKVLNAVKAIEDAIKKAFGDDSKTLIDRLVAGIEDVADALATNGPKVIQFLSNFVDKLKIAYSWLEKIKPIMEFLTPAWMGKGFLAGFQPPKPAAPTNPNAYMGMYGDYVGEGGTAVEYGHLSSYGAVSPEKVAAPAKAAGQSLIDLEEIKKKFIKTSEDMVKRIQEEERFQWKNSLAARGFTNDISDLVKQRRRELDEVYPPLIENYSYLTKQMVDQRTGAQRLNDELERQAKIYTGTLSKAQEHSSKMIEMAIENMKREAEEIARRWDKVFKTLNYVGMIADAIPGKFGAIASAAVQAAESIAMGFAQGGVVGGIVAAVSQGIKAIGKLFGPTDYEKRVRDAAKEMRSLTAEAVKAAGSMQRLALNAAMVGINIKGAFDSRDPEFLKQVLDEMATKTQKLNAAMEEYGFTWQDLGTQYRAAALGDLFTELLEKTKLLQDAGIDYSEILSRQSVDYSKLLQQALKTGTEIPLAMKKTLEDLLAMGKLVDENGNKFEDLEDVTWSKTMTEGFRDVTTAIYELRDAIVNGVGGAIDRVSGREIVIRTRVDTSGMDMQSPEYMATGGVVPWTPRGSDTVPAMLTPGERVIPRGAGGGTVVVELDKRWLAQELVPEIPGAVKRMGIR